MPNPIINRRVVLSGNSYSPAAQAYFNALATQPSPAQKARMDTYLFKPLVSAGIFTELDRLFVYATEIQSNGLTSLVNPTSTAAAEVNSPAWVQYQGYTGNGTTSYVNTNYVPSTGVKFVRDSASMGLYLRTNTAASSNDFGCLATREDIIIPRFGDGNLYYRLNDATYTAHANSRSDGLISIARTASNAREAFRNGVSIGTSTTASTGAPPAIAMYIGARNNSGTADTFSTRQFSSCFMGSGTFNHLTVFNIIQAYMTQIGSAV